MQLPNMECLMGVDASCIPIPMTDLAPLMEWK
jgi:hypothetical protein